MNRPKNFKLNMLCQYSLVAICCAGTTAAFAEETIEQRLQKLEKQLAEHKEKKSGFHILNKVRFAGLVHMNGRVYDYNVGRFLGVDPFLQFPENSQSANPYSYIMNNPMAGTDPTGYLAETDKKEAIGGPINEAEVAEKESKVSGNGQGNEKRDSRSARGSVWAGTSSNVGKGNSTGERIVGAIKRVGQKLVASQVEGFLNHVGDPDAAAKGELSGENVLPINGDDEQAGADYVDSSPAIGAAIVVGQAAATKGRSLTQEIKKPSKEILTRKSKGGDGGESQQIIERDSNGNVISRTHVVKTDGKTVHQHQNHIGKSGGELIFP